MAPPYTALVNKFIPNNGRVSRVILKVCDAEFKATYLPIPLVKMMVSRALDLSRMQDMDAESKLFYEKLTEHARSLRPRFVKQIAEANRRGRKW